MNYLTKQIENAYGLKIINFSSAPRGFCAKTYFLDTDKGRVFAKVISNLRLAVNLSQSLNCQAQISALVDFVLRPIPTIDGKLLFLSEDNRLVSLFTCINGSSYQTGDYAKLVHLMSKIYKLNIVSATVETFPVCLESQYKDFWNGKMKLSHEVLDCVNSNISFIRNKWNAYNQLCNRIKNTQKNFFLTHGDMPGNLMIDKFEKLFIIDWDDIYMAPIERDFWIYMDTETKIRSLVSILRDESIVWAFNQDYYNYYLLTRLFDDLYGYMELDMHHQEEAITLSRKIVSEVFDWLFPLMNY